MNETWNDQHIIEEMAFGYKGKYKMGSKLSTVIDNGTSVSVSITRHESQFSDGTRLEIVYADQGIDIEGEFKPDHISLFAIKKP